jgi:hypothetical protein
MLFFIFFGFVWNQIIGAYRHGNLMVKDLVPSNVIEFTMELLVHQLKKYERLGLEDVNFSQWILIKNHET